MHLFSLCLAWACLGGPVSSREPSNTTPPALQLWQQGQDAMRRGRFQEAIALYEKSLALDSRLTRNHLSLAAAFIEQGDEPGACRHLTRYLDSNPHHLDIRIHLADLKLRMRRLDDARAEFERCIAVAQIHPLLAEAQLLHCHARLMEIAELIEDGYGEHLHRGIGLSLLARQVARASDPDGELSSEGLLCKAAGELTLAQMERPGEARPNWYLFTVWSLLDQQQAAIRCLKLAAENAPFTDLTPPERSSLQVQCQCLCGCPIAK
jgi:tetratricopeptide (TPR) repeat protein